MYADSGTRIGLVPLRYQRVRGPQARASPSSSALTERRLPKRSAACLMRLSPLRTGTLSSSLGWQRRERYRGSLREPVKRHCRILYWNLDAALGVQRKREQVSGLAVSPRLERTVVLASAEPEPQAMMLGPGKDPRADAEFDLGAFIGDGFENEVPYPRLPGCRLSQSRSGTRTLPPSRGASGPVGCGRSPSASWTPVRRSAPRAGSWGGRR